MMHKALADFVKSLTRCEPEALIAKPVTAVLLALGSNHDADIHLPRVRENLAALGEIQLSTAFQNPDFTSTEVQPKPDYTNQCVHILLMSPMTLQQLQQIFKQFECDCNRQRLTEAQTLIKKVTMDIDILLIGLNENNSLSKKEVFERSNWIIMADRYPFKAHERAGLEELTTVIDRL